MLERYFKYPGVLRRMREGPLAGEIDQIANDLDRAGYSRGAARRYLSLVASFSRYASQIGVNQPQAIEPVLLERFLAEFPRSTSTISVARSALGHVLRHLAERYEQCVGAPAKPVGRDSPLLDDFHEYLREVRGLELKSREGVLLAARRMLSWYRETNPRRPLARLRPTDVLAFTFHIASRSQSGSTRSGMMSHVRNFLRYLRWSGVLGNDLARHVPRTPVWRLARIPEHLAWEDVQRLISSIGPSEPAGKRDRALLLLLATTGIRNGELRRLELRDIRWRKSEVHLRQTKNHRDRFVPLVQEAGDAIADYILHGRPKVAEPTVFLSHRPPFRALRLSSTVSAIVRRRLECCGIRLSRAGAHLLRHSLATRMVHQRRPIKEVADLLGHQSIDATAMYVKVAVPQLADVALPFPGGAE